MATALTAVGGAPRTVTTVTPNAPQNETNSYLQRCVQDLNPRIAAMHDSNAFLWELASKAILVVFTVLAVGFFVAIGSLAPTYLPVVGITSFCLMNPAFQLYQKTSLYSVQTQRCADNLREIAQEYTALSEDPNIIEMKLRMMGIEWNRIPGVQQVDDLNQFRPLIARYQVWEKQKESYEHKMETYKAEALQLLNQSMPHPPATEDGPSLQKQVSLLRLQALQSQENSLICKVNAAFINAVIHRPAFAGSLGDLATFNESTFQEQAWAHRFNDLEADRFIEFTNPNIAPITFLQIQDNASMPIALLAQRFIEAVDSGAT